MEFLQECQVQHSQYAIRVGRFVVGSEYDLKEMVGVFNVPTDICLNHYRFHIFQVPFWWFLVDIFIRNKIYTKICILVLIILFLYEFQRFWYNNWCLLMNANVKLKVELCLIIELFNSHGLNLVIGLRFALRFRKLVVHIEFELLNSHKKQSPHVLHGRRKALGTTQPMSNKQDLTTKLKFLE